MKQLEGLNPGIVKTVEWLNDLGFVTTDSGDGETHDFACDLPGPYVHMKVDPNEMVGEMHRLISELGKIGVEIKAMDEEGKNPSIQVTYSHPDNIAILSLYNVKL